MNWNDRNLLQVWQAVSQVSGYSLSAELHEDKPCELRESHHPDGCKTAAFLSEELRGGARGEGVHGQM